MYLEIWNQGYISYIQGTGVTSWKSYRRTLGEPLFLPPSNITSSPPQGTGGCYTPAYLKRESEWSCVHGAGFKAGNEGDSLFGQTGFPPSCFASSHSDTSCNYYNQSPFRIEQIGKMKHSLSYIMKLKTPNLSNITSRKFNQKSFVFHFHQNCCGYVKMHLRSIQPHWSCFSFFSPSSSTSSPSSLGSFLFPFLFFWDFPFLSAGSSVLPFFFFFEFSFLDFSFLLCFLSFRLLLQKSLCCSQSSSWHFWLQKRA